MNSTQRNFTQLDVSRSSTRSEPASDLTERILLTLQTIGVVSEDDLVSAVGENAVDVRATIETLSNLRLINNVEAQKLELSSAGKATIDLNLLSLANR